LNDWGNPTVYAANVDGLTIGPDASDVIEIKSGEGWTTMGNTNQVTLDINGGINHHIHDVDMSRSSQNGMGMNITSASGTTTIENCTINKYNTGIRLNGDADYTITNNNLENSGSGSTSPALYLNSTGGVLDVRLNDWGNPTGTTGSNTAIFVRTVDNLTIGPDASDAIEIKDGEGFATMGTDYAINISGGDNIIVHDLIMGGSISGEGVQSTATSTTIENNSFFNRVQGINSNSASGNDINCNTFANVTEAIQVSGIQTGLSIVNNSFECVTRGIDNNTGNSECLYTYSYRR